VFDLAPTVEGAEPMFQALGLEDQVTFVAGDILKSIPVEADIYLLKGVLQQHGDIEARTILQNCRSAMKPNTKLIVYERLMPESAMDDPAAIMLDLHMMVVTGGKARTELAMKDLLSGSGFSVASVSKTYNGLCFIEAKPS
jgi:hypothetical protein